jgi:hypothetical protein
MHQEGVVEITSGLSDGAAVVVDGQDALTDHQLVRVR